MRWQPAIRTLPPYHDDPAYIDALAASLTTTLAALSFEPDAVLASFHGLPRAYLDKGDPYHCHCQKTTRLLREKLGWSADKLRLVFQSRFGAAEWLQPYFDVTVAQASVRGREEDRRHHAGLLRRLPGDPGGDRASAGAETFRVTGGTDFAAVACLNDSETGMALIETLVRRELSGWL